MFGSKSYSCFVLTTEVGGKVTEQMLDARSFEMGRSFDAALVFADPSISKVHARISQRNGHVYVEDMGSRNGTYVDGKKLEPRGTAEITEKSRVVLGHSPVHISVRLVGKVMIKSNVEADDLKAGDKIKVLEVLEAARTEAKRTVELAHQRAMESEREAISRHQEKLEAATQQASQILAETREEVRQSLAKASSEADQIIQQASRTGDQLVEDAKVKAHHLFEDSGKKLAENEKLVKSLDVELEHKKKELESLAEVKKLREEESREWQKNGELIKAQVRDVEEQLKDRFSALETSFFETLSQLQMRRTQVESEIATIENKLHDKQIQVSELDRQVLEAGLKIEDSRKLFEEHQSGIESLKTVRETLESTIQRLKDQSEAAENEHHRKVMSLQSEMALETQKNIGQMELLRSDLDGVQSELRHAREALAEETKRLESVKKQHEADLSQWNDNLKVLKQKQDAELQAYRERQNADRQQVLLELSQAKDQLKAQKQQDLLELEKYRGELKLQRQQAQAELTHFREELNQQKKREQQELVHFREGLNDLKKKDQAELAETRKRDQLELAHFREELKRQKQQEQQEVEQMREMLKSQKQQSAAELSLFENELKGKKQEKVRQLESEIEALQADSMRQHLQYKNELSARVDRYREELTKDVLTEVEMLTGHLFQPAEVQRVGQAVTKWLRKSGDSDMSQKVAMDFEVPKAAARARFRYTAYGLLGGGLACVLAVYVFMNYYGLNIEFRSDKPVTVAQVAKAPYRPDRTPELRDTLAESVLFTQDYSEIYSDPAFQSRWRQKVSEYLLKQWRIPEEKSIQIISLQLALIEGLQNQGKAINPDNPTQDIEKLKQFEEDSLKDLKAMLGTKSKYEAYRNFDREFFKKEQSSRLPASQ